MCDGKWRRDSRSPLFLNDRTKKSPAFSLFGCALRLLRTRRAWGRLRPRKKARKANSFRRFSGPGEPDKDGAISACKFFNSSAHVLALARQTRTSERIWRLAPWKLIAALHIRAPLQRAPNKFPRDTKFMRNYDYYFIRADSLLMPGPDGMRHCSLASLVINGM